MLTIKTVIQWKTSIGTYALLSIDQDECVDVFLPIDIPLASIESSVYRQSKKMIIRQRLTDLHCLESLTCPDRWHISFLSAEIHWHVDDFLAHSQIFSAWSWSSSVHLTSSNCSSLIKSIETFSISWLAELFFPLWWHRWRNVRSDQNDDKRFVSIFEQI